MNQAARARIILGEYQQAVESFAFQLSELSSECGNNVDGEWQGDDGSTYYEARVEMREASNALAEAKSMLRLLAVSLQYCEGGPEYQGAKEST